MADLLSQAQQAGQQAVSSLQDAAAPLTSSNPAWPRSLQLPQLGDLRLPQLSSSSFPSQWQLPQLPSQWRLPQAPALPTQFQLPSAPSLPSQWSLPSFASPPSVPSIPALDSQLDRVLGSSPAPHFGTQAALDALQSAISWTSYEVRTTVIADHQIKAVSCSCSLLFLSGVMSEIQTPFCSQSGVDCMQILQLESAPQLQQGLHALAAQYNALLQQAQQQVDALASGLASGFGGISSQLPQGPSWQAIAATLQSQGAIDADWQDCGAAAASLHVKSRM